MKNIKLILKMCCVAMMFTACEADIPVIGDPNPNLSIYDLRKIYNDAPVTLSKTNMKDAVSITGVVISDVDKGNTTSDKVVLQVNKGNNVNGVVLNLGSKASNYKFGD